MCDAASQGPGSALENDLGTRQQGKQGSDDGSARTVGIADAAASTAGSCPPSGRLGAWSGIGANAQCVGAKVPAHLWVFEFGNGRVWKRYDFQVMEQLQAAGCISNPHQRSESVYLTEAGFTRAKELASRLFGPGTDS